MQNLLDKLKGGDGAVSAMLWIGLGIIILIVVIVIAMWIIRTLRPTLNMSGSSSRGARPQRLAVTDAFTLDREGRKLIIVRRDNAEHLLLIGGPNDVVVETNIQRAERSPRERSASAENLAMIDPPAGVEPARAPIAPQGASSAAPQATQRPAMTPPPRQAAPVGRPAPSPEPPRIEQPRMAPPRAPAPAEAPPVVAAPVATRPLPAKFDDEFERAIASMIESKPSPVAPVPRAMPAAPPVAAPPVANAPAPAARPNLPAAPPEMAPAAPEPMPRPALSASPATPPLVPSSPVSETRSEPMSEMARRLSEVLQKPISQRPATIPRPTAPAPSSNAPASNPPASTPPASPPKPLQSSTKPVGSIESEMDLLEEEMARLLGRPGTPGKS